MDTTFSDLVSLGIYSVVGLAVAGLVIWRVVAMARAARTPLTDDQCVACGSKDVTAIGPGVYRCSECGYEGGSGLADALASQERARIEALPAAERRAGGVTDLRDALQGLASAQERLAAAAPSEADVGAARSEILQASDSLRLAGLKLGDATLGDPGGQADASGLAVATMADAAGGMVGVAARAAEASMLRERAGSLASIAEAALARAGVDAAA